MPLKCIVTFLGILTTFQRTENKIIIKLKKIKMVHTMLIEKYFKRMTLENTMIKTDLSFTLLHTNFGLPIKLFRHYAFSALGTPDTPSLKTV
jgi:hypothetical protein